MIPVKSTHRGPAMGKVFSYHLEWSIQSCIKPLLFNKQSTILLRWRHNGRDDVSNHKPNDCLLNRLFRRRSKKTSKLRVTGLCAGNSRGPVNSPHKRPVTRKMSPFDDVIMSNDNKSMMLWRYIWNPRLSFYKRLTDKNSQTVSNVIIPLDLFVY